MFLKTKLILFLLVGVPPRSYKCMDRNFITFFFVKALETCRPLKVMKVLHCLHFYFIFFWCESLLWRLRCCLFRCNLSPAWKVISKNLGIQSTTQQKEEFYEEIASSKPLYEIEKDIQVFLTMQKFQGK